MSASRDVVKVIPQLLEKIPYEEVELRRDIEEYNCSLFNQAPEVRVTAYCWIPLQTILQKRVTVIDAAWKKELLSLFNGEDI